MSLPDGNRRDVMLQQMDEPRLAGVSVQPNELVLFKIFAGGDGFAIDRIRKQLLSQFLYWLQALFSFDHRFPSEQMNNANSFRNENLL